MYLFSQVQPLLAFLDLALLAFVRDLPDAFDALGPFEPFCFESTNIFMRANASAGTEKLEAILVLCYVRYAASVHVKVSTLWMAAKNFLN